MKHKYYSNENFMLNKSFKAFFVLFSLICISISCEKNDPLSSLGTAGDFTANIYFVPLSPLADANTAVECEIEYWTIGEGIATEELLDLIREIKAYEIDFDDIKYTFEFDTDEVIEEESQYASYSFDFTNWNPAKNAYVVRPKYEVPSEFARISISQSNTDKVDFASSFTDSLSMEFYSKYLDFISESLAYDMFVTKHSLLSQSEFESNVNNNGSVEESELNYFSNLLSQIPIDKLIGSKYKYTNTKRIGVTYTITNQLSEYAESVTRYFNVR